MKKNVYIITAILLRFYSDMVCWVSCLPSLCNRLHEGISVVAVAAVIDVLVGPHLH